MRDVLKTLLTLWYVLWSLIFLLAATVSMVVLLGIVGDGVDHAPWVGLLGVVVFWYASSDYRKKFIARVERVQKNSDKDWNDDER